MGRLASVRHMRNRDTARLPLKPVIALFMLLFAALAFGAEALPVDAGDDFGSPLLLVGFMLIGMTVVVFLVGAGIAVTGVIAMSAALCAGLGIVSTAAWVGLVRRRCSSGLRALHYQVCALAAMPAGIGALWLGSHYFAPQLRGGQILVIGSLAGMAGGLLLALAFDRLVGIMYRRMIAPRH